MAYTTMPVSGGDAGSDPADDETHSGVDDAADTPLGGDDYGPDYSDHTTGMTDSGGGGVGGDSDTTRAEVRETDPMQGAAPGYTDSGGGGIGGNPNTTEGAVEDTSPQPDEDPGVGNPATDPITDPDAFEEPGGDAAGNPASDPITDPGEFDEPDEETYLTDPDNSSPADEIEDRGGDDGGLIGTTEHQDDVAGDVAETIGETTPDLPENPTALVPDWLTWAVDHQEEVILGALSLVGLYLLRPLLTIGAEASEAA
jgi:hypothetical protein